VIHAGDFTLAKKPIAENYIKRVKARTRTSSSVAPRFDS